MSEVTEKDTMHSDSHPNLSDSQFDHSIASDSKLWDILKQKKIVLLVGSGGVGKTTVSASIALFAAMMGKRVLAVTIDPAKRLADSLGLKNIGNVETPIDLNQWLPHTEKRGELWIMMLDVHRSLDDLINGYAPSPDIAQKIMENNIYKAISDSLAGTEEIVALGKLYELQRQGRYDMIIVDTAPTRHAIDFFESPTRLMNLLDMRIIQWFIKPIDFVHRVGFRTFKRGTNFLIEKIERSIGLTFFTEIASFLQNFEGMFDKLQESARRINVILKDESKTVLGAVSSAEHDSVSTTLQLSRRLVRLGLPLRFHVVNRLHPLALVDDIRVSHLENFISDGSLSQEMLKRFDQFEQLRDPMKKSILLEYLKEVARRTLPGLHSNRQQIGRLAQDLGTQISLFTIPWFDRDIYDIGGLIHLNSFLFGHTLQSTESAW